MDPLPNISEASSQIVQQEIQIVTPIDESKLLALPTGQFQGKGSSSCGGHDRGGRSLNGQGRSN